MNIEIANRLVKLRKEKGYSQEELANQLGISRQAVSKWERAEASPDTENLISLAQLYHISLDELLDTGIDSTEKEQVSPPRKENSLEEPEQQKQSKLKRILISFPYPILAAIIYFLLGQFGGWWHPGWLIFLTIPLYYRIVAEL